MKIDIPPQPASVHADLRQALLDTAYSWWQRAQQLCNLPTTCPLPAIDFDLTGRCAGQVQYCGNTPTLVRIRFNLDIAHRNRDDFIEQTVPHEIAHVVALLLHGRKGIGHGQAWRQVMRTFKKPATRCHQFDMTEVPVRTQRRFPYRCGCSTEILLSATRHNRIQNGRQIYLCRRCRQALSSVR